MFGWRILASRVKCPWCQGWETEDIRQLQQGGDKRQHPCFYSGTGTSSWLGDWFLCLLPPPLPNLSCPGLREEEQNNHPQGGQCWERLDHQCRRMAATRRSPIVAAAVPGGDGREPEANHPAQPGVLHCCQGRLTRVKRRGDALKPLPKISIALPKPMAAVPISWLAFTVPDEGLGSTSYLLSIVPQMGSRYQLRAQGQPTFLSLRAVTPRLRSWRPGHA